MSTHITEECLLVGDEDLEIKIHWEKQIVYEDHWIGDAVVRRRIVEYEPLCVKAMGFGWEYDLQEEPFDGWHDAFDEAMADGRFEP